MIVTAGAVLSILYVWPVKLPLPVPVPPSLLPAPSTIESSSTRFSPSVPSLPVLTVTVYVVPLPLTPVMVAPVAPAPTSEKSVEPTPVTLSLKTAVQWTMPALVGVASTLTIELAVGAVLSTVYVWPVKLPLPVPVPPSLFPEPSTIESSSTRFSPSVPSLPVLTVTVYVVPLPLTPLTLAPVAPAPTSAKSDVSTPLTLLLKVTVQCRDEAFVGVESARLIELTVGAVASTVKALLWGPSAVHEW